MQFECDDFILHFAQCKRKFFAKLNYENYDNTSRTLISYQHFEHQSLLKFENRLGIRTIDKYYNKLQKNSDC